MVKIRGDLIKSDWSDRLRLWVERNFLIIIYESKKREPPTRSSTLLRGSSEELLICVQSQFSISEGLSSSTQLHFLPHAEFINVVKLLLF